MAMNIFRLEFNMRLRSVITWSVAVAAIILVYISLFPQSPPMRSK